LLLLLLLPLLQETQDYKRVQQVVQASFAIRNRRQREFADTARTGILPLAYGSSLLDFFLQIRFLFFDRKLQL
jgi:hypothetical protein